ncbi:MAG: cytoskeletal protein RodZ [Verrucomicrobiaceae bacterium]|nr:cytoskeletal protein RodZ [Verrucomicrobiaceae bacterium]MDB6116739.1 cytoskeletal protein RodZ [Verrucomicrobiaceae bacterium]
MSVMNQPLCEKLRTARESRGLSLADVAHTTRIPISRLTLLEEGNYAAFGNMAYARSFIKAYSRFLEVDAESVIEGLPSPVLGGPSDYRHLTSSYGPWIQQRGAQLPSYVNAGRRGSPAFTALVLTLILATGLAVYASVYVVPGLVRKSQSDNEARTAATATVTKPLAPSVQMAQASDPAHGEPTTVYLDALHPNVTSRRAIPVEQSKPAKPLAQ